MNTSHQTLNKLSTNNDTHTHACRQACTNHHQKRNSTHRASAHALVARGGRKQDEVADNLVLGRIGATRRVGDVGFAWDEHDRGTSLDTWVASHEDLGDCVVAMTVRRRYIRAKEAS